MKGCKGSPLARSTGRAPCLLVLLFSSCGFQPLYSQATRADLPAIYVNNINGRYGQLIRESLQEDLGVPASGAAARYQLDVNPSLSAAGIAVQPDNSTTFSREVGTASWTLRTVGIKPLTLASSSARTVDGFNNIDQQYFQSTISSETTQARLAANLADEITLQVAAFFKRRAPG